MADDREYRVGVHVQLDREVFVWAADEDEARDLAVDEAGALFGHDRVVDVDVDEVREA